MTFVNMLVMVMSFDVEGMSETACSAEHLFILLSAGVNPVELACLAGLRELQQKIPEDMIFTNSHWPTVCTNANENMEREQYF